MSKRPKIKVPKAGIDYALDAIAMIGLMLLILLPLYYYSQLPEQIPTHFDAAGDADGFGKKTNILILPIIGVFTFLLLFFLAKVPHVFNYGVKITEENAPRQYQIAVRLTRTINALSVLTFLYLAYQTIQIALEKSTGISNSFIWILMFLIVGSVIYFLIQSLKDG